MTDMLRHGPLGQSTLHLCIDMQNLLGPGSPWHAPWAMQIVPKLIELTEHFRHATVFTRFVLPPQPAAMPGLWQHYFRRWRGLAEQPELFELLPPLQGFVPPAEIIDKPVYSAFTGQKLLQHLQGRRIDTLVVSGAETDICVLSTVLGAIDHGYRVIVVQDALCSSVDETHDALLAFYHQRLSEQVEIADVAAILAA
ncbi:MAG TPA: isochorismatase family cysteine hydrolase [Ferrovibrio sp.]|uniref:cysteine hydrolase family protein n=1 Tax=Ferrovibrio sp. TaxID=1917215 RepID=UPI002ED0727A